MTTDADHFGLTTEKATDSPGAVEYIATLEYASLGDRVTAIPDAVIISVNGTEAGRISAPMSAGTWTETVNLTKLITPGQLNDIQVYCETYRIAVLNGYIDTEATVKIRLGRRKLFAATYYSEDGRRITQEKLSFSDDRPAP